MSYLNFDLVLLSKVELEYLTDKRKFSDDYGYTIKSRLLKKLKDVIDSELPILIAKGYLTDNCKLTEFCKVADQQMNKNGLNHAQIGASSNFHAPWSGRE
jgi:hypothetical protein